MHGAKSSPLPSYYCPPIKIHPAGASNISPTLSKRSFPSDTTRATPASFAAPIRPPCPIVHEKVQEKVPEKIAPQLHRSMSVRDGYGSIYRRDSIGSVGPNFIYSSFGPKLENKGLFFSKNKTVYFNLTPDEIRPHWKS